jgi:hypothetical protein
MSLSLAGCAVVPHEVYVVRYQGDLPSFSGGRCGGPKDRFTLPFHGVFLSVGISSGSPASSAVSLYVPQGYTAQWTSTQAGIDGTGARGRQTLAVELEAYDRKFTGMADSLAPMPGRTAALKVPAPAEWAHAHFGFHIKPAPRLQIEEGTLQLPPLKINGEVWPGPLLQLKKATSWAVEPLNC